MPQPRTTPLVRPATRRVVETTIFTDTPAEPVTSTTPTPALTRPHQVVPVGRQHADDQGPMGQCVVCHTVGEWNALVDLLPSAYGCSGRPAGE